LEVLDVRDTNVLAATTGSAGKSPEAKTNAETAAPTTPARNAANTPATMMEDWVLKSGVPVVRLQADAVSDVLAARLAIGLLGHILFLKNQIPL